MGDWRRNLAVLAAAVLCFLELESVSPKEVARRWRYVRHYAFESLESRRFAGSAASFDRNYFVFLNSVRGHLASDARGVALFGLERSNRAYYLAAYWLAPTPALASPDRIPPGWLAAVYGDTQPSGWVPVASVFHGVIYQAPPQ
jgi:hypothetical protein